MVLIGGAGDLMGSRQARFGRRWTVRPHHGGRLKGGAGVARRDFSPSFLDCGVEDG